LRQETLEALARKYIGEALRLEFSKKEIGQIVRDQLKTWQESQVSNSE
jgi:hypothetical protein